MIEINKIYCGDCTELLKHLDDNSIDSIVTDPPYGWSFMGKKWDYDIPPIEIWQECLRVLKPGGHILSACGTRTYHRMAVAIEDAGFEIRDLIAWVYGSGFPKSLNVGKAVDKRGGVSVSWFGKWLREWREKENIPQKEIAKLFPSKTGGLTGCVANWELGLNMPTNEQFNLICKTFNLPFAGLKEAEREIIGKDKNWGEKGVVPLTGYKEFDITKGNSPYEGYGTALKPAMELFCMARKPLSENNIASNVLKWGTGGINIDGCRVPTAEKMSYSTSEEKGVTNFGTGTSEQHEAGRFPANIIHDGSDEVVGLFPYSKVGERKKGQLRHTKNGDINFTGNTYTTNNYPANEGSAARFFKVCNIDNYCFLCYNTLHKDNNKEDKWKLINVDTVEKNLKNIQAIKESIARLNVQDWLVEKSVQFVRSVVNLCDSCVMNFVREVVLISDYQEGAQYQEESQVMQDFIGNSKKCILIQNLVSCVEKWESIDTTQTTTSLLKLFGSANRAIINYIQKTRKSEPNRLIYTPKASKAERNMGCEGLEKKKIRNHGDPAGHLNQFSGEYGTEDWKKKNPANPQSNHHPTVKPIALMKYLCRLITPPQGIVLDPFAGSGSTLIAAEQEDFNYIGIELEEEYVQIAEARLNYKRQLTLI